MSVRIRTLQRDLAAAGFDPGGVDGIRGPGTMRALARAADAGALSVAPPAALDWPASAPDYVPGATCPKIAAPAYGDISGVYGEAAGPACTAGRVALPFEFALAWDTDQKIRSFACHKLVAGALTSIFAQAAAHYGEARYRALGLDLFGGCFNHRAMRGGSRLSTHSWGVAVDLDPERNQLRWNHQRASFARPEYEPFWQIVEAHGAVSLGRSRNFDWMHFQFVKA